MAILEFYDWLANSVVVRIIGSFILKLLRAVRELFMKMETRQELRSCVGNGANVSGGRVRTFGHCVCRGFIGSGRLMPFSALGESPDTQHIAIAIAIEAVGKRTLHQFWQEKKCHCEWAQKKR